MAYVQIDNTVITNVTGTKGAGTAAASSLLTGGVYNSGGVTLTTGQQSSLQLTSAGLLRVDPGTVAVTGTFWQATQPVSGTVAATQSGTWTVQPGNTANTTAWLIDARGNVASGATDSGNPVKVGGVYNSTLPTLTTGQRGDLQLSSSGSLNTIAGMPGAVAGADGVSNTLGGRFFNQGSSTLQAEVRPFVWNGTTWDRLPGTTSGLTVAGTVAATQSGTWNIGSITTLPALVAGTAVIGVVGNSQGSTTSGQSGPLVQGAVTTAAPTYTTAQTSPLSLTTGGLLRVDGSGVTQPVSISGNQAVNIAQMNGVAVTMGNGVAGTGVQRVTIASDSTGVIGATQSGTWNITNVSGTVSLPTGAATATNQTNVTGTKAAGTAAANSVLTGAVYNSGGVTLTTGQQAALQMDSAGNLKVTGGGGGTQFAEDAPHTTGDLGTMMLAVRNDTPAALAGTNGDYIPLTTNANGLLLVAPNQGATSVSVVSGTFTSSTQSSTFNPLAGRGFNLSLWGTFVASIVLERRLDGTNWLPCTSMGSTVTFTGACTEVCLEPKAGVDYRLNCTWTSGTVNYRLEQ
jgi:hypothetical protein